MSRYHADENLPYFCTITVLEWLPVLIESRYVEPVLDSLRYCRAHKYLKLFGFVVMPNHVHMICAATQRHSATTTPDQTARNVESALHEVMRDFKRFTSRQIHDRLKEDGRSTLLHWLRFATPRARQARGELGLWRDGFHPQAIWSPDVFEQKLDYLHDNPCRKGLVRQPEEWWFSSAAYYAGRQSYCLEVDRFEL